MCLSLIHIFLLVVMALKGYPLLIRYQKRLLILAAAIFAAEADVYKRQLFRLTMSVDVL